MGLPQLGCASLGDVNLLNPRLVLPHKSECQRSSDRLARFPRGYPCARFCARVVRVFSSAMSPDCVTSGQKTLILLALH